MFNNKVSENDKQSRKFPLSEMFWSANQSRYKFEVTWREACFQFCVTVKSQK